MHTYMGVLQASVQTMHVPSGEGWAQVWDRLPNSLDTASSTSARLACSQSNQHALRAISMQSACTSQFERDLLHLCQTALFSEQLGHHLLHLCQTARQVHLVGREP